MLVPPPVQLTLERQLNKSILIGWNPPPDAPPGSIESYHVYVNGLLKTTVRASERTRALVEGVDSTKVRGGRGRGKGGRGITQSPSCISGAGSSFLGFTTFVRRYFVNN